MLYCCTESGLSRSDPSSSASYERADPGSIEETGEQTHGECDAPGRSSESEGSEEEYECQMEELWQTNKLIELIRNAELGDTHCKLGPHFVHRLRNPPEYPLIINDPDLRLSIDVYLATTNASQETYNSVRQSVYRRYPDSTIISFDRVKRQIAELSGVVPVLYDMCVNSCLAYAGPWTECEHCPLCNEPRYDLHQTSRRQFYTLPIGPQLQALWRISDGARAMRYRERRTQELLAELLDNNGDLHVYDDILCGSDYLDQVIDNRIKSGDMVLMLSIDGAQLYQKKASDTWIYIWIVVNHAPEDVKAYVEAEKGVL